MRIAAVVQSLGLALVAAALLVACGGDTTLAPTRQEASATSTPFAIPSQDSVGPTPVEPASPISVPTGSVTATPITGLPSASPTAASASTHRRR